MEMRDGILFWVIVTSLVVPVAFILGSGVREYVVHKSYTAR